MFKNLSLSRPLAVIDLETTGTDVRTDRIVEIAVIKFWPDGRVDPRCRRIRPGLPIPPEATAVHGIRNEDVANEPSFEQVASGLLEFLDGCDLCGFNLKRFDLKLLVVELDRCGKYLSLEGRSLIDPLEIYHEREKRDLTAAVRFYCNHEHEGAHGACSDAEVTAEILDAMLGRYSDLPRCVQEIHDVYHDRRSADLEGKFVWIDDRLVCNFGKHKGRNLKELVTEVPDYLRWMLSGNFMEDTKDIVRQALAGDLRRSNSAA
jgi:DNA polymerase III subunit epsilon